MVEVIPGIGIRGESKSELAEAIKLVAPHVEWVQMDVADDTFIPNTTFLDFSQFPSPPDGLHLEAHLMVDHPEKYIRPLVDAGFERIIAHVECNDPRYFLEEAEYEQIEVGLALDGPSELELLEPFLEEIDVALIMTIEAGFSGQPFLPETLDKIRTIKEVMPDLPIEVDGGINDKTARLAIEAGANRLGSTSYIFKNASNVDAAIRRLKKFEDNMVSTGELDDEEE